MTDERKSQDEDELVLREFIVETTENLEQADACLLSLEQTPSDIAPVRTLFRAVHTLKSSCGWLGFRQLEELAHAAETLLAPLRAKERPVTPEIIDALLATVDLTRRQLNHFKGGEKEEALGPELQQWAARLRFLAGEESRPGQAEDAAVSDDSDDSEGPEDREDSEDLDPPATRRSASEPSGASETSETSETSEAGSSKPAPLVTPPSSDSTPPPESAPTESPPPASAPRSAPVAEPAAYSIDAKDSPTQSSAAAAPPSPAAPLPTPAETAELSVRVDVKLLDELMKLIGELVLTRNQVGQFVGNKEWPPLIAASQRLNLVTTELQDRIMLTRMQPLSHIWGRFPRLVRDAAHSCGKTVKLEMEGADTELDRTMIEAMRDPLTHLVRNSVDHGIESPAQRFAAGKPEEAVVRLRARHEEGQVHIEVEDDGRGIDVATVRQKAVSTGLLSSAEASSLSDEEALGLIFRAGFSTREQVTELSGRGVGMDVVKTDVERVGGRVEVHSVVGSGTRITLRLPLTLAILSSVLVECAGETYAIPQVNLLELVLLTGNDATTEIREVGEGAPVYSLRGKLLPILRLRDILGSGEESPPSTDDVFVMVLQAGGRRFGLVVDGVLDTQEIVVKPLGRHFTHIRAFAGATILGDGRLALILDPAGIAQRGRVLAESAPRAPEPVETEVKAPADVDRHRLLLMNTRTGARLAVPLEKVQRLEEIPESEVEAVGGREVVQYRGGILRLLRVEDLLDEQRKASREKAPGEEAAAEAFGDGLQVVVHSESDREVGLVVHEVLDIVEERLELQETRPRRGVLGSAVLAGRVTEVLDLEAAIAAMSSGTNSEPLAR